MLETTSDVTSGTDQPIVRRMSLRHSGVADAGGLVGTNAGLIEESYSAATRSAAGPQFASYGGIAAVNTGTIANNVFWDTATTRGAPGVVNGTQIPAANGLTTAQMSVPASFGSSWNFSPNGTWAIPSGATSPVLRWQVEH